ncbi:MAG: glycosyl hydrolase family 18 protein [Patescibacteria group bacterium]
MNVLRKAFYNRPTSRSPQKTSSLPWYERSKLIIKLILLGVIGFSSALAVSLWVLWEEPIRSPISSLTVFRFLQESRLPTRPNKVVYGFLPYWNMCEVQLQPELTHLSYFSLTIAGDGSIITRENDYQEPGYNNLQSERFFELSTEMLENQGGVELVLTQFNNTDIASFLRNPQAHQQLIDSLDGVILAYPITGINIDIEPSGSGSARLRDDLTTFVTTLRTHLDTRYDSVQLSIDVYASASNNQQIWDIPALAQQVDYMVVMAYDFHRRTSTQAGPVAPLFGGNDLWDSDINQHLQEFIKFVPSEKILLGVPFYGYGWQTTSRDAQSHTFPNTGSTASISRVESIRDRSEELQVQEHWSEEALSPYISYIEDDEIYVIYYENSRSISYKLDYVNQLDLGGVAIWALGYEGDSRELWDVVARKIQ